jgi:menaquinone-dependent protoporphyrinogen oxidase
MARALVVVGTRHGGTREMAEWVADGLRDGGLEVDLFDADGAPGPEDYDIAVVGGAVYAARWVENVREWTRANSDVLKTMPCWIFSSGPVSGPPFPTDEESVQYGRLLEWTDAREHRCFPGRIDTPNLRAREKAMCIALRVKECDYRPKDDITSWAKKIAAEATSA